MPAQPRPVRTLPAVRIRRRPASSCPPAPAPPGQKLPQRAPGVGRPRRPRPRRLSVTIPAALPRQSSTGLSRLLAERRPELSAVLIFATCPAAARSAAYPFLPRHPAAADHRPPPLGMSVSKRLEATWRDARLPGKPSGETAVSPYLPDGCSRVRLRAGAWRAAASSGPGDLRSGAAGAPSPWPRGKVSLRQRRAGLGTLRLPSPPSTRSRPPPSSA